MRIVDMYDSFTLNECNGTGYSLAFGCGFIDVYDCKGKHIAQFWGGDAPTMTPESLRPKGEWISVEDRLPKKDDDVLCSRGNHIGAMMDVYTYKGDNKWEDSYGYVDSTDGEGITHWMPLPEPPKGE